MQKRLQGSSKRLLEQIDKLHQSGGESSDSELKIQTLKQEDGDE